jgi:hypothetical protein
MTEKDFGEYSLEKKLYDNLSKYELSPEEYNITINLLNKLRDTSLEHRQHYDHSIRVGFNAIKIKDIPLKYKKILFLAGVLHDIGKVEIDPLLLGKTSDWTLNDYDNIKPHVLFGYNALIDKSPLLDIVAEIVLRHHQNQNNPYPNLSEVSSKINSFSKDTRNFINEAAKIIATTDYQDASHRRSDNFNNHKF